MGNIIKQGVLASTMATAAKTSLINELVLFQTLSHFIPIR